MTESVRQDVKRWLENVVIGLNLCPFAARPHRMRLVDIVVSTATDEEQLLTELHHEIARLIATPVDELETTLIAVPNMLLCFQQYNDFLDIADALLEQGGWQGEIQIASFHPDYQFVDSEPDDTSNLTNCSPVPIFHLIREQSLTDALMNYADPDKIPSRNIAKLERLTLDELKDYFPYLYK
ncbi:DUF1415 domain-containing protein [Neiella marina]|uniref:DUF1415 domain-containing protein n=1 Tax=Neiella holothuriorum TaxID=2870530 RepID=A0ABS7ED03_9GAMM|nr:DUF1415 domain-containing protein [Neiella holothuriorum]MBW8190218.1 DUF1415 domain-containing protein [Neiella holothuriorum]